MNPLPDVTSNMDTPGFFIDALSIDVVGLPAVHPAEDDRQECLYIYKDHYPKILILPMHSIKVTPVKQDGVIPLVFPSLQCWGFVVNVE